MTDTNKRIKAYKAALPGLKERVAAVALLLAMSVIMMTSASFAWLTISRRPEVSGANTTIAANGNLEIALAQGDGRTAPGESKVGDSSAAENQDVPNANLTWGNLINLSDAAYGLENLTMRPAQLNTAALLTSPLYGAMYGSDGRITQLSSNFGYAKWNLPQGDKPGYFGVSEDVGVRAISSTTVKAVGAEAMYYNMVTAAKNKNLAAANAYVALGNNDKYMPSLATMMGLYMTARMNPDHATLSNPDCAVADIQNLRDMYKAFLLAYDAEADAIAALANLALFLQHGDGNYAPYTAEMIYTTTTAKLKSEGIQVTNLEQFIKDRNTLVSDAEKLDTIASSGTSLKWKDSGLNEIVNNLVNVGACTIGADNTPISSIGASNAMGYLSGTQEAKITNGILYRFEERTGGYISVKNLSISATVNRMGLTIPATVKANIQTTAPRDYNLFTNDLTYTESLNDGDYAGGIPVAEDTYGLAVDFWVRTNAEGSFLTLEGNLLTESKMVRAMGEDANGNEVELYTLTLSETAEDGTTISNTIDVYEAMGSYMDEEGNTAEKMMWYSAVTHTPFEDDDLGGQTPVAKMVEEITVLGYEGENRVWGDNELLSVDATTQGSGSCYVYYADTPEDQARSLKLLEAFNVAFVDEEGSLMAEAIMDTEHFYAVSGRVIVPLVLDPGSSINLGEDYEGNVTYAITSLQKNTPTRITAIVYLDGTKLTNQEVLAAADIQGQLNVQFGSSADLHPIANEELEGKERRVSASVDKTSFDYDTATSAMVSNVTVHVDGDEPSTVTAFFLRSINASQGSREQVMTFTKNESGEWVSSYEFTVPGNYVLRTVQLDGIDYVLADPPEVKITGFALRSLTCSEATDNHIQVLTAENTSTVNLSLQFAADDESKLPRSVQGRFLRDDGTAVNIDFTYNATNQTWSGSATFLVSGEYTMQYLVLDDRYVELDTNLWLTADITLGMRVAVYTTSPHKFKYVPSEMAENEKLLAMQVKVMDNAGGEMPGMDNVKLTYGMKGSGVKTMDTDLTWNGTYYVGELTTAGPGIWQFANVVVGSNTLTNATTSPTFTIQSPEPPEYDSHRTNPYQYAPKNDATMNVLISNSSAATVQAYIMKSGATEGTWVEGVLGTEATTDDDKPANYWNFAVPKDANGYQDGNWTLTTLKLWDVFAADGTAYTEEAPLEMDVSDTNNVTKVVARVFVSFAENKGANFGVDAAGKVTGAFMDSYTISGLDVVIKDFEGPLKGVNNVKIDYVYAGDSVAKGGYSGGNVPGGGVTAFTIAMKQDANDSTKFAQEGTQAVQIAGTYNPKISFAFDGGSVTYEGGTLPANAPKFTVSSIVPSVAITAISPTGTFTADTTGIESGHQSVTVPSWTATNATVYFKCSRSGEGSTCDPYRHNYSRPSVTITLSGIGNASSANLSFGSGKYIYNGTTQTDGYAWTANGGVSRNIGYYASRTASSDDKTPAGTLTASTLSLVYNNVTYMVTVPTITINNPY